MDPEGSTPDNNQGDLEDHSPQQQSADIVGDSQPSNEEDNQFFGDEPENEEPSDGAPSQTRDNQETQETADDTDTVDPELKRWADSQNIALTTETEVKLAQRLRDTQKMAHEKAAEAKNKFNEAVNGQDDDKVASMERKFARMEFFDANPDARALEGEMFDLALEARDSGNIKGFEYYQTPQGWKDLYALAKAKQLESQGEDSYEAGRQAERTNLAKKQQASKVPANANDSKPSNGKITDADIARMSQAEYNQFRAQNPDWNPFG